MFTIRRGSLTTASLIAALFLISGPPLRAQLNNGGAGGILIDAEGVVNTQAVRPDNAPATKKRRAQFATDNLTAEFIPTAEKRVLSLKRLDDEVRQHLEERSELPLDVRYLGGLLRIEQVEFAPQQQDVFLIGPAEGFGPDASGRMLGLESGRPPMQLDDLVVALRAAQSRDGRIGCSIDPTQQNVANLQRYLQANSRPASTAAVQRRYRAMAGVLGKQEVSVWGVPESSHFSLALVEADLRMKRISLGIEPSGVKGIVSHLSLLAPQGNSMQRWWFVPQYDPLETNAEGTIYRLSGPRARLLSQEEISDGTGNRQDAARTRQSTFEFAQRFSEHFEELARHSPAFAELQSLYDLSVAAQLIQQEGRNHLGSWEPETLLRHDQLPVESYPVPKLVPSASTFRAAGRGLIIGVVGGVTISPREVTSETQVAPVRTIDTTVPFAENRYWRN